MSVSRTVRVCGRDACIRQARCANFALATISAQPIAKTRPSTIPYRLPRTCVRACRAVDRFWAIQGRGRVFRKLFTLVWRVVCIEPNWRRARRHVAGARCVWCASTWSHGKRVAPISRLRRAHRRCHWRRPCTDASGRPI